MGAAECVSDEITPLSRSSRNFPRFPETIRQREIRGICNAVSGGDGDHSGAETTVYNARPPSAPHFAHIAHGAQQNYHNFSVSFPPDSMTSPIVLKGVERLRERVY